MVPPPLKAAPPSGPSGRAAEAARKQEAKYARIRIWQSEIDLSEVFCSCSGAEDEEDKEAKDTPPGTCPRCQRTLDSQESETKGLKKAITNIFKRPKRFNTHEEGPEPATRYQASAKDTTPRNDTAPAAETKRTTSQLTPQMMMPPPRRPTTIKSGTGMYQSIRRETGTARDEASENTSVSSLLNGLSDDDGGRAKPKLTIDDTAARLRRAQKLLYTQARG